jgi:hypothetical protein
MDRIINKLAQHLAGTNSSRRGFMRTLGRITLGGAGAIAAIATGAGIASANPLLCCSGNACSGSSCPGGGNVENVYYCCTAQDCVTHVTVCNDCYVVFGGQRFYECTYTTTSSSICGC